MKQQKLTTFKIKDAPAGVLAAACGITWVLSLLEIACGDLREALHAGSFGGILNLYLEHRALYDAALHRVFAETGSFLLFAAVLVLAACFCGWCFFAALRRGGTSFSLTFAVFSIPVIALQLLLPTADARMPGLYFTCAGAAWLLWAFAGNHKKAILFLCLLLLTGTAVDDLFSAAGGEQSLAVLRADWSTKIETWRYGGAGSGMTFGRFRTDAAAERNAAAAKPAESAEAAEDAAVLRVTMSEPQPYYLRGYTGDHYTKDGWTCAAASDTAEAAESNALFYRLSEERFDSQTMLAAAQKAAGLQAAGEDPGNVIRVINTGASRRYLYLPYEAEEIEAKGTPLIGGGLHPGNGSAQRYAVTARPYLIDRYGTILDALSASQSPEETAYRQAESNYRSYVLRYDLELPETCRDVLAETFPDAAGVRTSGEAKAAILETLSGMQYDESVTDSEEKDFAANFLTRKSGYDQHFTTAAVLAFRYYGIPARFAEGYLITAGMTKDAKAGEEIAVTAAQAHCWAEYYEDGVGWLPFETTPPYIGLMKSAGSIRIAEQPQTSQQPQKKPETDDKEQQTVTTESEVNYPMLAALLLLLLLLAAAAVWAARRKQRGRPAGRKDRPRRRDITGADRRQAILALLYFIRRREEKAARRQKQGAPAETRAEIEAIYQEARYSAHPVREEDYQKVLKFYRQMKKRK